MNFRLKNKSKRLRKKLYLGEFAIHLFEVKCTMNLGTIEENDSLMDLFDNYLFPKGLSYGGLSSLSDIDIVVCSQKRYGSPSEEERLKMIEWLKSLPQLTSFVVGDVIDAHSYNP